MNTDIDHLSSINKKQRQKMLMLMKNRAQNVFNRPTSVFTHASKPSNSSINSVDYIKQYQSNKKSDQFENFDKSEKSFDYNSTLFRNLRQEQNIIAEKPSQYFMNNASSVSHGTNQNYQSSDILKDNTLLSKIDELLNGKKVSNKPIKNVYDEYLEKKSMTSSSLISNTASILNSNEFSISPKTKQINMNYFPNKLRTIEQQKEKATLTIDRQQLDTREKNRKTQQDSLLYQVNKKMKKPPIPQVPVKALSTIQRQKKKIQETMQQIKKQSSSQYMEKDSLVLELSDNDTESQKQAQYDRKILKKAGVLQKQKQKQKQRQEEREKLKAEKQQLLKQLSQIEQQLEALEMEEEQEE